MILDQFGNGFTNLQSCDSSFGKFQYYSTCMQGTSFHGLKMFKKLKNFSQKNRSLDGTNKP